MRYALTLLAAAALLAAVFAANGCRGCAKNADLDNIPGMKDSGIPDPHAAKEHEKELQQLNKDIERLSKEAAEVAMDPNMSQAEKEKRLAEIEKELEVKSERVKEIAEDVVNRDL